MSDPWTDDPRFEPVLALAQSCRYEADHTHQVTRLALMLFDQLTSLHQLDDQARFELIAAALLHDIGWCQGGQKHHKTALQLIVTSPVLTWDMPTRQVIGCIARYHRRALPKAGHKHYQSLSVAQQQRVGKLAALLRVADGLDYSHMSVVRKLTCDLLPDHLSIHCVTDRPAPVDVQRALGKGDLFMRVYERSLTIQWSLAKLSNL